MKSDRDMPKDNVRDRVPGLQAGDRVILFDGVCRLCSTWARFVIRFDRELHFKLATVQSEEGQAILSFFGLPLDEYETMLLVEGDRWYAKSDAFLRVVRRLPFPWPLLTCFRLIPSCLRDWVYDRIARNRYRWFGKYDTCRVPSATEQRRFLGK